MNPMMPTIKNGPNKFLKKFVLQALPPKQTVYEYNPSPETVNPYLRLT
jgi:hypothetical protein